MRSKNAEKQEQLGGGGAGAGVERSGTEAPAPSGYRGRPGRRSVAERTGAVLELLSGKASVDQLARRFGVQPATVERWREIALVGVAESLRQGSGKSSREVALEKELRDVKQAFTRVAIQKELLERALSDRPSPPGRWPR